MDIMVVVAPTREEEPPAWRERDMMMMIIIIIKTGRRRDGMVENKVITRGGYTYALLGVGVVVAVEMLST